MQRIHNGKSFESIFCISLIISGQSTFDEHFDEKNQKNESNGYWNSDTNSIQKNFPEQMSSQQRGMSAKNYEAKLYQ